MLHPFHPLTVVADTGSPKDMRERKIAMRDSSLCDTDVDPVEKARQYRDQLKGELASVEAFLSMAEKLSNPRSLAELEFWLWDDAETPATLH